MIILGIVLLIVGFVVSIPILWTIGIIWWWLALCSRSWAPPAAIGGRKYWY